MSDNWEPLDFPRLLSVDGEASADLQEFGSWQDQQTGDFYFTMKFRVRPAHMGQDTRRMNAALDSMAKSMAGCRAAYSGLGAAIRFLHRLRDMSDTTGQESDEPVRRGRAIDMS